MSEKPKKSIFKKWWFWVIAVILFAGVVGAINKDDNGKAAPASGKTQNEKPNKEEPSKDSEKETNSTLTGPGQTITTKNFKVTLEKLRKLEGNDFSKPKDGNEFVEIVMLIENISKKDYTVSSMLMFDAYHDGFSVNESITAGIISDDPTMNGKLAAGKKLRGKLSYELPSDWKELEIDIDLTKLSFSSDGELKVLVQNEKE